MTLKPCPRCMNGQMAMEIYPQPCDECRRFGTRVCPNCLVHREWSCFQCGNVVYMPVVKRSVLYGK